MIEKIVHGDKNYAIIIRNNFETENIEFVTPPDNPLQIGVMKHISGSKVTPHIHKKVSRTINEIQEVLFIQSGKVAAIFYDESNKEFGRVILSTGDTILLIAGGHGFEFLDDTKMIEVKQGPYAGISQDKILLE